MSTSDMHSKQSSEKLEMSSLFMRRFKHGGRDVLRPLWFYIALNKNGYAATKRLIIGHGGKVSTDLGDQNTSREICLIDPHARASRDGRPAYSVDYIQSCIAEKRLLDLEDFRIASVSRTRKTSSKQHHLPPGPENIRKQAEMQKVPDLTQAKDSEVTDDLPCIDFPPNTLETHESPNTNPNSQMKTAPSHDAGGTRPRISNQKDKTTACNITVEKPGLIRPEFVTPKKRRSPDRVADPVEQNEGSAPQAMIKDSITWSKDEDNAITRLCVETKDVYHCQGRDPNLIFSLECWLKLEKANMLPTGRSATACFARAKSLWKNGETETPEPAEEHRTHAKRTHVSRQWTDDPAGENEIRKSGDPSQSHAGPQGLSENHETEEERPTTLKNASRHETREYIIELVGRIAKRGKVSKRNAFRALREERGHWKRALCHVTRRKRKSNV